MKQEKKFPFLLVALVTLGAGILVFQSDFYNIWLYGIILVLGITLLWFKPEIGIYGMALTYPFLNWQVNIGSLNFPVVDGIALLLFTVFVTQSLWKFLNGQSFIDKNDFFGVGMFTIFIVGGALSLLNVSAADFNDSLKYLMRPMIFFYLMFIVLPLHYIKEKDVLIKSLQIIFWVAIIFAVLGLYEFVFFDPALGFRRALPFGFGEFFPLGYNHNLLSEALVAVVPLGAYLYFKSEDQFEAVIYLVGTAIIGLSAFLTFSRAGWVVLMVEVALIFYWIIKEKVNHQLYHVFTWLIGLLTIPFLILLYVLNSTPIAQGSNLNRLKLIEIAFDLFKEHPVIGSGVGIFFRTVEQVRWYIIEYGGALDAHGVLFKVMAETGIIGVVGFFGFVGLALFQIYRGFKNSKNADNRLLIGLLLISCIGILTFQWFGTSYYVAKLWLPFGLALAAVNLNQ